MSVRNSLIGSPIERLEDLRFLRGRGEYIDDVVRPRLLHAAILRSPTAHGRIRKIDAAAALALSGVHAVLTAADFGSSVPKIPLRQEPLPAFRPYEQPVIVVDRVRYVGEPVAVVIADSAGIAEDALERVNLDIEHLAAVTSREASASDEILLFDGTTTNRPITLTAVRGDADAAFREADYVRCERFVVQRHSAIPMEPRGLIAEWDAGRGQMTVWGASKVPFAIRRVLAQHLGLTVDAIRMVENDTGGSFGVRGEYYPEDCLIPFAARFIGRPVNGSRIGGSIFYPPITHETWPVTSRSRVGKTEPCSDYAAMPTRISAPISAPMLSRRPAMSPRSFPGPTAFQTFASMRRCW